MREADVEGAVCQGCTEKLEFQGKEHLGQNCDFEERGQSVSWGEGGVRCMARDITSTCVLCKHLCTSSVETQVWSEGRGKQSLDIINTLNPPCEGLRLPWSLGA